MSVETDDILKYKRYKDIESLRIINYFTKENDYIYNKLKDELYIYGNVDLFLGDFFHILNNSYKEYCIDLVTIKKWFGIKNTKLFIEKFILYFRQYGDYIYKGIDIIITKRALLTFCIYVNSYESLKLYILLIKMIDVYNECLHDLYNYKSFQYNILQEKYRLNTTN